MYVANCLSNVSVIDILYVLKYFSESETTVIKYLDVHADGNSILPMGTFLQQNLPLKEALIWLW